MVKVLVNGGLFEISKVEEIVEKESAFQWGKCAIGADCQETASKL